MIVLQANDDRKLTDVVNTAKRMGLRCCSLKELVVALKTASPYNYSSGAWVSMSMNDEVTS